MKKLFLLLIAVILINSSQTLANNQQLLIVEFVTEGPDSASAEFVEIYNPTNRAVDVAGYKIEYLSKNGSNWSTKAELTGKIATRGRMLIATEQMNIDGAVTMKSGLSSTGGHLRISNDQNIHDLVGWGDSANPDTAATPTHDEAQSIKRFVNEDGIFIDTDDNSTDFFVSDNPTPNQDIYIDDRPAQIELPKPINTEPTNDKPTQKTPNQNNYLPLAINELFVDPKSPQTDKEDEFIELYNPHDQKLDLSGYELQSGSTWRYKHKIEDQSIEPGEYLTIYTSESGVTLSNGGSQVRLLDPTAKLVDGISYDKAKAGYSLARDNDKWRWTSTPTPDQANIFDQEESDNSETDEAELPHIAGLSSDSDSGSSGSANPNEDHEETSTAKLNTTVLALVGGLALIYIGYEYRTDIRNNLQKLRGNYRAWRANRQEANGRRGNRAGWRRWLRQNNLR